VLCFQLGYFRSTVSYCVFIVHCDRTNKHNDDDDDDDDDEIVCAKLHCRFHWHQQ